MQSILITIPANSQYKVSNESYGTSSSHQKFLLDRYCGTFYWHELTLIPVWISNHMTGKEWEGVTYSLSTLTVHAAMMGLKLNHVSKRATDSICDPQKWLRNKTQHSAIGGQNLKKEAEVLFGKWDPSIISGWFRFILTKLQTSTQTVDM